MKTKMQTLLHDIIIKLKRTGADLYCKFYQHQPFRVHFTAPSRNASLLFILGIMQKQNRGTSPALVA